MNMFFDTAFQVKNILLCMSVNPDECRLTHQNRPSHGLAVLVSGESVYIFDDGSQIRLKEGEILYLPKYSTYRIKQIEKGESLAVNFDFFDEGLTFPPFYVNPPFAGKYIALLRTLISAWNERTAQANNYCFSKLYELLYAVQTDYLQAYLPSKTRKIATDAVEYFTANLSRHDISVAEIASRFAISPEYFRKIFRAVYGVSPKAFLLNLRIAQAKELLLSREYTVGRVALLCGYEDESYFCREFKRFVGKSPLDFCKW